MNILSLFRFIVCHPLNRAAKAAAIARFARWQLASRLLRMPVAMPFVNDTSLVMEVGMTGATGNWYCGLLEIEEMGFVLHAMRPYDLLADVGANVGSYSVLAGGAVGASVVAVEPVPATFTKLLRNIAYNGIGDRVEPHCLGVSSSVGELSFFSSLDTMNRVALPDEAQGTIRVPVTTLDILFKDQTPTFMKIDVEGYEKWVLEGGERTLAQRELKAVLMETNRSGEKFGVLDTELFNKMKRFGYAPYSYDPRSRTIHKLTANAGNTIFLRDHEEIQNICRSAPRFILVNGEI